jgi:hypothetical protein
LEGIKNEKSGDLAGLLIIRNMRGRKGEERRERQDEEKENGEGK